MERTVQLGDQIGEVEIPDKGEVTIVQCIRQHLRFDFLLLLCCGSGCLSILGCHCPCASQVYRNYSSRRSTADLCIFLFQFVRYVNRLTMCRTPKKTYARKRINPDIVQQLYITSGLVPHVPSS
ncbi:hypothetical protein G7K_0802-t1 [Saitoella complicata NRRL Y-17804]|uniref:Uncharacterized protein n=1 Tax=Saitoella complicata (strain BCRC 22490 / CBS 7301 / JCM 7358 / NBRC 10748 / NRRL Y-17804) TaxID=698492 RepID=A0A0E9N9K4_SAICN|nr:hypothetical protein G7K_0802-t1 [Saitoella complicata NRRL Y-17804]